MSTTVSPENWIKEITKAEGITLTEGEYVAGQIVVGTLGGDFEIADVDSTDDTQLVFVLREAVTVIGRKEPGVGVLGTFKATGLTFSDTQTAETIAGALASKGIFLTTMMEA